MDEENLFEDFGIKNENNNENKKLSFKNNKSNNQSNKKNSHNKFLGKKKKREKEINNDSDSEKSNNKNNNNNNNNENNIENKENKEKNNNEIKYVNNIDTNENNIENNNLENEYSPDKELTSKEEDILISKQIKSIFPSINLKSPLPYFLHQSSTSSPQFSSSIITNTNSTNIPSLLSSQINMNMSIETENFSGGFHESIFNNLSHPPPKLKQSQNPPAMTFKFKLDNFQERAILCLENHQSVLVAAHTSAGKTVVAQYAIAMALRDKQRVIYTSPIKALSNQKYRDLLSEFKDVGLMTGDVSINTNASCLVMTTEILRNMLFKGTEITKEIAWVIFDEVHYMRDKERGVIWEETIILLSNKINYVFLSATIPNAREFAMWISKIKQQPCNVVYTDFRPVPLQHYIFPKGGKEILKVVDSKSRFKDENFRRALEVLKDGNRLDSNDFIFKQKYKKPDNEIKKIVELIIEKKLDPAIIFSFSKRECENNAIKLLKRLYKRG